MEARKIKQAHLNHITNSAIVIDTVKESSNMSSTEKSDTHNNNNNNNNELENDQNEKKQENEEGESFINVTDIKPRHEIYPPIFSHDLGEDSLWYTNFPTRLPPLPSEVALRYDGMAIAIEGSKGMIC